MLTKITYLFFRFAVALYTVISGYYFLGKPGGGGDEGLFMSDVTFIQTEGWMAAIEKGISIPYMLLTYPFTLVMEPHLALRMVNVLLFIGLLIYFYKRLEIKSWNFYCLFLFFFSTVGYMMAGTNDTLFIAALVIFMVETYLLLSNEKKESMVWWGLGLVIAFLTRKVIFPYAPVILLAIFFLWKFRKGNVKTLLWPLLILLLGLGLNFPSLQSGNGISYDQKLPPDGVVSTWPQRQYLAQQLVNEGKLANYNHPNWKETDAYLENNGMESLPKSTLDGMLHDPKLTTKEFFKDFLYTITYGVRQLGLILPTMLLLAVLGLYRVRKPKVEDFVPWSLFLMVCIFSLIIISFVELRWLAPVFVVSIFYFYWLSEKRKIPKILVLANYAFMTLLSCYGMYGLIGKL